MNKRKLSSRKNARNKRLQELEKIKAKVNEAVDQINAETTQIKKEAEQDKKIETSKFNRSLSEQELGLIRGLVANGASTHEIGRVLHRASSTIGVAMKKMGLKFNYLSNDQKKEGTKVKILSEEFQKENPIPKKPSALEIFKERYGYSCDWDSTADTAKYNEIWNSVCKPTAKKQRGVRNAETRRRRIRTAHQREGYLSDKPKHDRDKQCPFCFPEESPWVNDEDGYIKETQRNNLATIEYWRKQDKGVGGGSKCTVEICKICNKEKPCACRFDENKKWIPKRDRKPDTPNPEGPSPQMPQTSVDTWIPKDIYNGMSKKEKKAAKKIWNGLSANQIEELFKRKQREENGN